MELELVSADEAVARLMNIDFIPATYSLEVLLEGFLSEAQNRYDEAKAGHTSSDNVEECRIALRICEQRLEMAANLLAAVRMQVRRGLLLPEKKGDAATQNLSWDAVQDWASKNFGSNFPKPKVVFKSATADEPYDATADAGLTPRMDKLHGKRMSKVKLQSLLVTLYLLARYFATKHPGQLIKGTSSTLVIDPIAKALAEKALEYSGAEKVTGQGSEAIKDRLEAAEEAWQLIR